jgi:cytochrome c553
MSNCRRNFNHCLSMILLSCALVSLPVTAAGTGDAKKLFKQICASCHGEKATGNDVIDSPAIAGQRTEYLKRQLVNFSSGKRGANPEDKVGGQMIEMAKLLKTDEQQSNMASYLSSLPPSQATPSEGDVANGFKYYQACGSCHGAKAEGNEALHTPRLAGLSADYLKRQHQNFIIGFRGSQKDDLYGRQMAMMAGTMTDEKILTDVIAYITSLNDE